MTKLASLNEMTKDGWKLVSINNVQCLRKKTKTEIFIAQWDENVEYFQEDAMRRVIEQLGQPDNIHTLSGGVCSLEYFVA